MGAKTTTPWTLFIDESGDFDDPEAAVAVGGLLIRGDTPGASPASIAAGLRRALPWFPWPLHAGLINQVAYVAIAAHEGLRGASKVRGIPKAPAGAALAQAAADAISVLAAEDPDRLSSATACFREGRKLDPRWLVALSDRLRRDHQPIARALRAGTREAWALVRSVPGQLAKLESTETVLLLAASETETGDSGRTADARYYAGLEALFDRVLALLRLRAGSHRVGVKALARDVRDPLIRRSRRLMPQDVGKVIQRLPSDARSAVRLVAEEVGDYHESVCVEFVLADFIANRARRSLGRPWADLPGTEAALAGDLGAPARSGNPPRTHLAATGAALQLVRFADPARSPQEQLPWHPPRRRWAVEQAWEWAGRG